MSVTSMISILGLISKPSFGGRAERVASSVERRIQVKREAKHPLRPCRLRPAFEDWVFPSGILPSCHDASGVNWSGDTAAEPGGTAAKKNRRFPIHVSLRQSCSWRTNMTFASPVAELIRWVQQGQFEICQTAWLSGFGIFQGSMKTFLKD